MNIETVSWMVFAASVDGLLTFCLVKLAYAMGHHAGYWQRVDEEKSRRRIP
mgnify:CR=1 FL=1